MLLSLVMENEGGNTSQQPIGNTRVRHNWIELEEETLLIILEEMVVAGKKEKEERMRHSSRTLTKKFVRG